MKKYLVAFLVLFSTSSFAGGCHYHHHHHHHKWDHYGYGYTNYYYVPGQSYAGYHDRVYYRYGRHSDAYYYYGANHYRGRPHTPN